jgi:hypothetical protein
VTLSLAALVLVHVFGVLAVVAGAFALGLRVCEKYHRGGRK